MSNGSANKLSEDGIVALEKQYRFQWEPAQDSFVLLYPEGLVKLPGSAGEIQSPPKIKVPTPERSARSAKWRAKAR